MTALHLLAQREQCARCAGPRRITICTHGDISTVTVTRLLEIKTYALNTEYTMRRMRSVFGGLFFGMVLRHFLRDEVHITCDQSEGLVRDNTLHTISFPIFTVLQGGTYSLAMH